MSAAGLALLAGVWGLMFGLLRRSKYFSLPDWRVAFLLTNVLWGACLTWITEAGSVFRILGWPFLGAAWAVLSLICWMLLKRTAPAASKGEDAAGWRDWPLESKALLWATAAIILAAGVLALFTAPTTWDSMTYHLPRVMHWMQNQSVAPFGTSDTRQVESGPWPGYVLLHLFTCLGNDWPANMVEWYAMVTSVAGASLIASLLLRKEPELQRQRAEGWTAFLVVTMPTGLALAITPQTDYVVCGWVVTLAALAILTIQDGFNLWYVAGMAGAFGLGMLSKATMAILAGPLLLIWVVMVIRKGWTARRMVLVTVIFAVGVGLLAGPQFTRNLSLFGRPLGSRYVYELSTNKDHSPGAVISNAIRNLALHSATGLGVITRVVQNALEWLHNSTGHDLNDQNTTFFSYPFAFPQDLTVTDNGTGQFYHLLLLGAGLAALPFVRAGHRRMAAFLVASAVLSFVGFCAYLRWQPWHSRFHLPYFVMLLPCASIVMVTKWAGGLRMAAGAVLGGLALHALGWNHSRPLLTGHPFIFQPREQQYFLTVPNFYLPAAQAAEEIVGSGSREIGLHLKHNYFTHNDEMEYPLWVLLRNRGFSGRIYHADFTNETSALAVPLERLNLVVSGPRPPEKIHQMFPFRLDPVPFVIQATDQASRWCSLSLVEAQNTRMLQPNEKALTLEKGLGMLQATAGRSGKLFLSDDWIFVREQQGFSGQAVAIQSEAGFSQVVALPLTNQLEIPLPANRTPIAVKVLGAPSEEWDAVCRKFNWRWQPSDDPLRWVYIASIRNPGQEQRDVLRVGVEPCLLELVSGSAGRVALRGNARIVGQSSCNLLVRDGLQQTNNFAVRTGPFSIAFDLKRGTNMVQLRVENPQATQAVANNLELADYAIQFPQ